MSYNYKKIANSALKLIKKFGAPLTIERQEEGDYDPATGGNTITTISYGGTGVRVNYKMREIDGTLVQSGDFKLLVEAKELLTVPETLDSVIFDGNEYSVVDVGTIAPAQTPVVYILQVRS